MASATHERTVRWRRLATALACVAVLPQLIVYASYVRRGEYPGSALKPRLDAMIEVSAVAAGHGPFCAIGTAPPFHSVGLFQTDLGLPALADVLGRLTGAPIGLRTLGVVNLAFMAAAFFGLIAAVPPTHRAALVPVFLWVPLCAPGYVSADIPTVHGAFAVLALALPLLVLRSGGAGTAVLGGVLLFILSRFRGADGIYSVVTLLATTGWILLRRRDVGCLRRATAALVGMALLGVAWNLVLRGQHDDPRMADKDTLSTHDLFKPLLAGVGWSPNRWGIAPWDPRVAQFMADRLGLKPVPVYTLESERRARGVYASLWREAPRHLAKLYVARVPSALRDGFFMGGAGAAVWLLAAAGTLFWSWRPREVCHSRIVIAGAVMVSALIGQSVLLDPRFLYAYPLRVISAIALATSVTAVAQLWFSRAAETPPAATGGGREPC